MGLCVSTVQEEFPEMSRRLPSSSGIFFIFRMFSVFVDFTVFKSQISGTFPEKEAEWCYHSCRHEDPSLSHTPPPPHTSACGWSHDQLVRDHVMCGRLLFHSLRAHVKTFFSSFLSFVRKQIIDALKNAAVHCCWQCASVSDLWENDWLLNKVKDRGGGNVLLNMTNTGVGFFCLCCYTGKKGILFFIIRV